MNCLKKSGATKPAIAELNGSPTDNNATLFKQGYDSVLKPLYKAGKATKVADQSVPDWDNQKALTIFEQMLQKTNNKIDGVLAANDGLGNSVISALKSRKLKQIPVTGQDATPQGIQNILVGRPVHDGLQGRQEGGRRGLAAGDRAVQGQAAPAGPGQRQERRHGARRPVGAADAAGDHQGNVKVPFDDGFLKPSEVCVGQVRSACKQAGISLNARSGRRRDAAPRRASTRGGGSRA